MLNRRSLVLSALVPAIRLRAAPGSMQLCMHQTTSTAAGYRKSLQGYARAGIKYVEVIFPHLEPFVKTEGMPAARRLLSDLGLTAVSGGGVRGLWEPQPQPCQSGRRDEAAWRDGRRTRCRPHGAPVRSDREIQRGRLQAGRGQHARTGRDRQTDPDR